MNREIKFRMWNHVESNPQQSRMFYSINQVIECLKQQLLFNNGEKKFGYDHASRGNVFMQYTGIKDKNGKDIWQGDIITYSDGRNFIVEWNDKMAGLWARELKHYDNVPHGYGFEETENYEWQVIGNIYENPELLQP